MNYSIKFIFFELFYTLVLNSHVVATESVGFGEECNASNRLCNEKSFLECDPLTSLCICKDPQVTFYDPKDSLCKTRARESCNTDIGSRPCVEYSACTPVRSNSTNTPYHCACFPHLVPSRGHCFLAVNKDCSDSALGSCDEEGNVECSALGLCTCVEKQNIMYDPVANECKDCKAGKCGAAGVFTNLRLILGVTFFASINKAFVY